MWEMTFEAQSHDAFKKHAEAYAKTLSEPDQASQVDDAVTHAVALADTMGAKAYRVTIGGHAPLPAEPGAKHPAARARAELDSRLRGPNLTISITKLPDPPTAVQTAAPAKAPAPPSLPTPSSKS